MTLKGRFGNTSGRPYIEGRLHLPRLAISGDVSFCVDTGADATVLLPADGMRLGVDYEGLGPEIESVGVGGISLDYREEAVVIFSDPAKALYAYTIELVISSPSPDVMALPSLLGRDILNRWRMMYDPMRKGLSLQVREADYTVPLS